MTARTRYTIATFAYLLTSVSLLVTLPPSIAQESAEVEESAAIGDLAAGVTDADEDAGWRWYGGDQGGARSSSLTQIDKRTVRDLKVAWRFRTGEVGSGLTRAEKLTFEVTPILFGDTLVLITGTNIVIALDAVTGRERWRHDPRVDRSVRYSELTARGVSAWIDQSAHPATTCARRILFGTLDARLIALDARNGTPCNDFGTEGSVDLTAGMRNGERGNYLVTSPPALHGDLAIVGSSIGDNGAVDVERGTVRAYDIRSGALRWSWQPLPTDPDEATRLGWQADAARRTGGANAWSAMSVDTARDLVFVPTGSASPDFFGGERSGDNLYANSLVALRASTGEVVWHHQLVHHDLWDYDLAAQPMLIDIEREGKAIPAVVQATKHGLLFVFDRETGEPVYEVVERAVPRSDVIGEQASPTQPFPATPALTSQAAITPQDAWGLTFYDRDKCRAKIGSLRSAGIFTPPSTRGTIMSPGYAGGVNWGSLAFDPQRQLVIAAVNHIPMVVTLVPRDRLTAMRRSEEWQDSEFAAMTGTPYGMRREMLASPFGLPCTAPPWGTLAAIDLRQNTIRWQVVLGSTRDKTPWFTPPRTVGMPNAGGPITTRGGLIFVAAATDNYLRAFDIDTGHELWKGRLPAGGQATPMTYEAGGRQFVVIAAGGHGGLQTTRGDHVIAFALPVN